MKHNILKYFLEGLTPVILMVFEKDCLLPYLPLL